MDSIQDIPELAALDAPHALIRIPPEQDVPITDRVRALLDTAVFRRLAKISQLGLVSLVYPGALHTRFEHSLGVYRIALMFLRQLASDGAFRKVVSPRDAERFLVCALLHDLGHWPFCHPIEDMQLPGIPRHEALAGRFFHDDELSARLQKYWQFTPQDILHPLNGAEKNRPETLLASLLSGPIDIDKMDYLARDSLHAGVPYGRNFDQSRLLTSLCLNAAGDRLAITYKGKTAAEMMVFARYVMFSEVYWHHGVRAATAMLQRAFYMLTPKLEVDRLFTLTDEPFIQELRHAAQGSDVTPLVEGLFGPSRRLYKRVAQFSFFEQRAVYDRMARRPYEWLVRCAGQLAEQVSRALGETITATEILFDAPPVEREVELNVDVYYTKENCYRPLSEVSPVVRTLAREQFDDYVKRVRIFAHPRIAARLREHPDLFEIISRSLDALGS